MSKKSVSREPGMSQKLKVPPTKSALLALRRQVGFLQQGYTLLERKRELLTRLVYEHLERYRTLRVEARNALEKAYHWLGITHLRMGKRMLHQAALGLGPTMQIKILPRSSLGVEYPAVTTAPLPLQPLGLMWTDASFDETRRHLAHLAMVLATLGEAETALRRMIAEQRKTQKRVNALKYNVIPRYQATIRFIQAALEEEERNTLFQIKVLREREAA
jgi:V/A-type H+-transporting ATPase subunit D